MKKTLLIIASFLLISIGYAQKDTLKLKYDTVIVNKAYKSYYSKTYQAPVVVVYQLYHGGGECSRAALKFKNDVKGLPTTWDCDGYYRMTGFDKGHMANAEDFSYDCTLEELTFRYYNAVPQSPELNRGPWKHYETLTRKLSQHDTLEIICYNEFGTKKMGGIGIPEKCYKFVFDKKTKEVVFAFYYTNNSSPDYKDLLDKLQFYGALLKLIK